MYLISIVYESLVYRVSFFREYTVNLQSRPLDRDARYLKFTVV